MGREETEGERGGEGERTKKLGVEGGYLPPFLGLDQVIWHFRKFDGGDNSIYQHQDQESLLNEMEVPPVELLRESVTRLLGFQSL